MLGGAHLLAFVPLVPGGYFKMGTYNVAGVPGALDDTLTDLRSVYAIGTAGVGNDGKALTTSDVTYVAPNTLRVRCFLDTTEGNGAPDDYYEVGVFDAADRMIAFGTFTAQPKTGANTIENFVNITF